LLPTFFRQHFSEALPTIFLVNIFRKCCQYLFVNIFGSVANIFSSIFSRSVANFFLVKIFRMCRQYFFVNIFTKCCNIFLEMMDNFVWSFNIFQKGGFRQHIFVNIFQIVATFLEMLKKFQHCLLPRLGRRGPRPALWPARASRGEAGEPHVRLRRSSRRAQWGGAWSGLPRHQGSRATADLAGLVGAVGGGQGCSHGGARATPAAVEAGEKAEEAAMARVHAEGQWVTVKGGDGFTGGR
jgi:hypothetical protein